MPVINCITAFQSEMQAWWRDIHAHPELGYEEHRTSKTAARLLAE